MTPPLLRTSERKDCHDGAARYCKRCIRNMKLVRRYGITADDWDALLAAQDGRCRICPVELDQSAHVDHDHGTGRVRGLLCRNCNMSLGWYEMWKEEADAYLAATSSNQ